MLKVCVRLWDELRDAESVCEVADDLRDAESVCEIVG